MIDSPAEKFTYGDFIDRTCGDVFIGGLGMGFLPLTMSRMRKYKTIDVVEKNKDVINLVEPYIRHPKIRVLRGDVFTFAPLKQYDAILLDIWGNSEANQPQEMEDLKARYRSFLTPGGIIECWLDKDWERRLRNGNSG